MRKPLLILLATTAALLALYAGYRGYKVWKQSHMIALARGFIAKGDGRNAQLSLQQALQSNSRNVEATRLMADLMQRGNAPTALFWRNRVVELAPNSTHDRLALATLGLASRDLLVVTNALAGLSDSGKQTAGYHAIEGGVAAALGRLPEAEAELAAASRLEPTNATIQLNLAVVRLAQTNTQTKAEGRAVLKQLSAKPEVACQALRDLITDALRNRQMADALDLSKQLLQQSNSVFADRLLRLDVLHEARDPGVDNSLAAFQKDAGDDPAKVASLAAWRMRQIGPADALLLLKKLPPGLQTNAIVALVAADCHVELKNWRGLQTALAPQNWGELEFVRHAYMALAFRRQDLVDSAKTEWEQALKAGAGSRQSTIMLLQLAAKWNMPNESEDLLWIIINRYPEDKWAVDVLTQTLFASGRTRPLMALFSQQLKRSPSDLKTMNNLAVAALLLDAQEQKPHDLAREVYEKSPTNASFASTYAFSLHLQSKDPEALKIMEKIPLKDLDKPSIAGYYGLILKATGNKEKAKAYLSRAEKAQLLPEEKKLFDQARAGV